MFNSLRGVLSAKRNGAAHLLTGGVEWEISMNARDLEELGEVGGETRIFTWLSHREDSMTLYGFADETRRNSFFELIKVEGIGPKAAMKIQGGISEHDLERALETGDVARLEAVPGLGKKTAQRMILSLKGKIVSLSGKAGKEAGGAYAELANALVEMGYEKRAALAALERAASELGAACGAEAENAVFRKAILYLSA
jgi:Holliday junction DNA helicase RuvA